MKLHPLALALVSLVSSGCMAVEALKRDPYIAMDSVRTAVNQAVFDTADPVGYYEYFGEAAYVHRPSTLCESGDLARAIETREIRCLPSVGRADPSCTDAMGCVRIELSPAVLANPRYRAAAMQAMTDPCSALQNPRRLQWASYPSAIGTSALGAWRNLGCSRLSRPRALSIEEHGSVFVLRMRGI